MLISRMPVADRSRRRGAAWAALVLLTEAAAAAAPRPVTAQAAVDATGAYETSIPIDAPPYYGLQPALRLAYSSQGGDGIVGVGWTLDGFSRITRASGTRGSPNFDAQDRFFLDGNELLPCAGAPAGSALAKSPSCKYPLAPPYVAYASRVETYERIAYNPPAGQWRVWDRAGRRRTYSAPTPPPAAPDFWHLDRLDDPVGRSVEYHYTSDPSTPTATGQEYPLNVSFGGMQIEFYWEARADTVSAATGRSLLLATRRLRSILLREGARPTGAYAIDYVEEAGTRRSLVAGVRRIGSDVVMSMAGAISAGTSLPPVTLAYEGRAPQGWTGERGVSPDRPPIGASAWPGPRYPDIAFTIGERPWGTTFLTGDFDGDGRTDGAVLRFTGQSTNAPMVSVTLQLASGSNMTTTYAMPIANTAHAWPADVNRDGVSDIVLVSWQQVDPSNASSDASYILLNSLVANGDGTFHFGAPAFTQTAWVDHPEQPMWASPCGAQDIDGDGRADVVCTYYQNDSLHIGTALARGDGTFSVYHAASPTQFASSRFGQRPVAFGDVNGDGLGDLQILDFRPSEMDACAQGTEMKDCGLHYDLLTAYARGDGGFTFSRTETPWEIGEYLASVYGVDLNGDGRSDYMSFAGQMTDASGNIVGRAQTALARADGGFDLATQDIGTTLAGPENVVTFGDFDGDGAADMLAATPLAAGAGVGCSTAATISYKHVILTRVRSNRDGTFVLPARWDDCTKGQELARHWDEIRSLANVQAADVNGDGLADFALGFQSSDKLTFRMADGVSKPTGNAAHLWIPADVTGDARPDYVYVLQSGLDAGINVLVAGAGNGFTQRRTPLPPFTNAALASWRVMDVDGDGRADLVHLDLRQPTIAPLWVLVVDAFVADGQGGFTHPAPAAFAWAGLTPDLASWQAADVDGDGRADLVHVAAQRGASPGLVVKTIRSTGAGTWAEQPMQGPFLPALGPQVPDVAAELADVRNWRLADVDGDGRADLVRLAVTGSATQVTTLLSRGVNGWAVRTFQKSHAQADKWWFDLFPAQADWHLADVNGDGRTDAVNLQATATGVRIHELLSRGNGDWTLTTVDPTVPTSSAATIRADTREWQAADVNGDGRADLVHVVAGGATVHVESFLATGLGGWSYSDGTVSDPASVGNRLTPTWRVVDIDGDGREDLVRVDPAPGTSAGAPRLHVSMLRAGEAQSLLSRVTTPLGGRSDLAYWPLSRFAESNPAQGCGLPVGSRMPLLARITVRDGRGAAQGTSYAYACARWSTYHRALLGWGDVVATTDAASNRPLRTAVTRYDRTDECGTRVRDVYLRDPGGSFIGRRDLFAYHAPGAAAPFDCLLQYENHLDYGSPTVALNAYTYWSYDEFGNVTQRVENGDPADPSDDRVTTWTYLPAIVPYIVALPKWVQLHAGATSAGPLVQSTVYCYDGDVTFTCTTPPTKGLVTARGELAENKLVRTRYDYDFYGNVVRITDPRGDTTRIVYDPITSRFPWEVHDALGHVLELRWDFTLGKPTRFTDANGATVEVAYDPLGRPVRTTAPGGGVATRSYLDWGDPQKQRVRDVVNDYTPDSLWRDVWLDGLGRPYRQRAEGDAAGVTFTRLTNYADASSLIESRSSWFRLGSTTHGYERFRYDESGRVVRVENPDGTARVVSYGADASRTWATTTDERGFATTSFADAFGRHSELRVPGTPGPASTKVAYDAADRVVRTTDAAGNESRQTYDLRGRRTALVDPNTGTRGFGYDDDGNLTSYTDARGRTTTFAYDSLERLRKRVWPDGTSAEYRFDEAGHGAGVGRLTSTSDSSARGCAQSRSASYGYDLAGHLTSETLCVDAMSYTMEFVFDRLGRISRMIYPGDDTVKYAYDAAGRLASAAPLVSAMKRGADGQLQSASFPNGTAIKLAYTPKRRWLAAVSLHRSTTRLYDARYGYGPTGLVTATKSATNKMNFALTYDPVGRLTTVTGDLTQSRTYDPVGSISSSSSLGAYAYPPPGPSGCVVNGAAAPCAQPHAVTHAGTRTYTYDKNGNLSSVFDAALGQYAGADWTYDDRPSVVSDFGGVQTTFAYDAAGARVSQIRGADRTRYFGPLLEHGPNGLVKTYVAGGEVVARRVGGALYWLHADQVGTPRVVTDAQGVVRDRYDYGPFGEPTTQVEAVPNDRGFAGAVRDTSDALLHFAARDYDATLGRFLSADPVIAGPTSPTGGNRYAYALDNPVSFADEAGTNAIPKGVNAEQIAKLQEMMRQPIPTTELLMRAPVAEPAGIWAATTDDFVRAMRFQEELRWYEEMKKEYPGISLETAHFIASAERVNAGWKWLSQFYIGEPGESTFGRTTLLAEPQPFVVGEGRAVEPIVRTVTEPYIGAAKDPVRQERSTPFNPPTDVRGDPIPSSVRSRNCEQCVASIVDAVVNGSFIAPASEYPPMYAQRGRVSVVLENIREAVGPDLMTYGRAQQGTMLGAREGTTFFVLFTNWVEGRPQHVTFGMTRGSSSFFYDPQTGSRARPVGYYESYPIIVREGP